MRKQSLSIEKNSPGQLVNYAKFPEIQSKLPTCKACTRTRSREAFILRYLKRLHRRIQSLREIMLDAKASLHKGMHYFSRFVQSFNAAFAGLH